MKPQHPLRVFIADDNSSYRSLIREIVNAQRDMAVVGEASNGDQAVVRVRELQPAGLDIVLMDIGMPVLDGVQATARITAADPHLPVVILTVSGLDQDVFRAVRSGAVGYLNKDLPTSALLRSLRGFHQEKALPMSRTTAAKVVAHLQQEGKRPGNAAVENAPLSPRERQVLAMIAQGAHDREISRALTVEETTVKTHVQSILRKLHARNRAEAVARSSQRFP